MQNWVELYDLCHCLPHLSRQQVRSGRLSLFPFGLTKLGLVENERVKQSSPRTEKMEIEFSPDEQVYQVWRHSFLYYCRFWRHKTHNISLSYDPRRLWVRLKKHSDYIGSLLLKTHSYLSLFLAFFLCLCFCPPCLHDILSALHHWGYIVPEHWPGVDLSSLHQTVTYIFVEELANMIFCMYCMTTTGCWSVLLSNLSNLHDLYWAFMWTLCIAQRTIWTLLMKSTTQLMTTVV